MAKTFMGFPIVEQAWMPDDTVVMVGENMVAAVRASDGTYKIMTDDDPNEAYDVVPMPEEPDGPSGWWTVTCNGIPVRHSADKAAMERYASDPELRKRIAAGEVKLWKKGQAE